MKIAHLTKTVVSSLVQPTVGLPGFFSAQTLSPESLQNKFLPSMPHNVKFEVLQKAKQLAALHDKAGDVSVLCRVVARVEDQINTNIAKCTRLANISQDNILLLLADFMKTWSCLKEKVSQYGGRLSSSRPLKGPDCVPTPW